MEVEVLKAKAWEDKEGSSTVNRGLASRSVTGH